jgi:hypothetical protein
VPRLQIRLCRLSAHKASTCYRAKAALIPSRGFLEPTPYWEAQAMTPS